MPTFKIVYNSLSGRADETVQADGYGDQGEYIDFYDESGQKLRLQRVEVNRIERVG